MGNSSSGVRDQPLVSLITVVLNSGATLSRTIESVFAQQYRPIDYIIIDGGSSDGTLELIKQHKARLAYWTSEPDNGISDAFNKGLKAAQGDYIGLLNADDWLSPDQIENAVQALAASDGSFVFGDLLYHAPDGKPLHMIRGDDSYAIKIKSLMPALNHPTMLIKRSVFEDVGGFDQGYRVAMDYDWALRAHLAGHHGVYSNTIFGHMTLAGTSDRHFVESLSEVRMIAIGHGQQAMKAWLLFGYRVVKGLAQRLLHRHAPRPLYRLLRTWFNRDYHEAPSDLDKQLRKSGHSL